ncbi:hypothetical protein BDD12DRAFT_937788 [Trichophaea hybrida]|nr:hypothetical protein BDD12DRAFT_937788 [Trichophaea hybrida]
MLRVIPARGVSDLFHRNACASIFMQVFAPNIQPRSSLAFSIFHRKDLNPPMSSAPIDPATSLLSLPPALLELLATLLSPIDVFALRLVSRDSFRAFASPSVCDRLLAHHFPFAPRIHNTDYDTLNTLLLRRRRLQAGSYTQSLNLSYPPPHKSQEGVYPGLHEFDADLGILLTAESSETEVEITVRSLADGGRSIVIPAPLRLEGETPGIMLSRDRVLLLYPRRGGGSLALILDGKQDGRTLWSALLSTSVYTGRRKLRPVFNTHYLAFITKLDTAGVLAITKLAPSGIDTNTVTCNLPVRPENLHSLQADAAGKVLLVAEVFPTHGNLHRIIFVNAATGDAARAFHLPMAPSFSSAPRDWGFQSTGSQLPLQTRPSSLNIPVIRAELDNPLPSLLLLLLPSSSSPSTSLDTITYDFSLSIATTTDSVLTYPPLNLTLPSAGTGELANRHNTLPAIRSPRISAHTTLIGANWMYSSNFTTDGAEIVQLLRYSTPPMVDSPASGWSTPPGERAVVDAGELARRLAAMQMDTAAPREKAEGWRGIVGLSHRISGKMKRAKSDAPKMTGKGKEVVGCEEVKGERGWRWWGGK